MSADLTWMENGESTGMGLLWSHEVAKDKSSLAWGRVTSAESSPLYFFLEPKITFGLRESSCSSSR